MIASSCLAAARHTYLLPYWSDYMEKLTKYPAKMVETTMLNLLSLSLDRQNDSKTLLVVKKEEDIDDGQNGHATVDGENSFQIFYENADDNEACATLILHSAQNMEKSLSQVPVIERIKEEPVDNGCDVDDDCIIIKEELVNAVNATAVFWATQQTDQMMDTSNAMSFLSAEPPFDMKEEYRMPDEVVYNNDIPLNLNEPQVFQKTITADRELNSLLINDSLPKWDGFIVPITWENGAVHPFEETTALIE